jgi:site-specific DNA recombinase
MSDLLALTSALSLPAPRVAFYGRTSNQDLQDPSLSIPRQLSAATGAATKLGAEVAAHFWDIESGRKDLAERGNGADTSAFGVAVPRDGGINDLLTRAAAKEFEIVIVESIDRLSRITADGTQIEQRLKRAGVQLFAADEPLTLNPTTILTRRVKQAIAEFIVLELTEKSWEGMSESTKQGWHTGGPAPYGYKLEEHQHPNPNKAREGKKKHRLIPDSQRAPVIKQIFGWYCEENRGLGEITRLLDADHEKFPPPTPSNRSVGDLTPSWSRATVQAILRNPKYTGFNVWNRHDKRPGTPAVKPDAEWIGSDAQTHTPLVTREVFEKVPLVALSNNNRAKSGGARANHGRQGGRSETRVYPFRGRLFCEICGRRLSGTHQKGGNWYRCQFIDSRTPRAAQLTGHPKSLQVKEAPLLDAIFEFLARRVFRPERLDLLRAELTTAAPPTEEARVVKELGTLGEAHAKLAKKIKRLVEEMEDTEDRDDPVARHARTRIAELASEQERFEARITELKNAIAEAPPQPQQDEVESLLLTVPDLSAALASYSDEDLAELFAAFDLEVRYDKRADTAEISIALVPELLAGLTAPVGSEASPETTRPARRAGQRSRSIAGAGFEPATSGL